MSPEASVRTKSVLVLVKVAGAKRVSNVSNFNRLPRCKRSAPDWGSRYGFRREEENREGRNFRQENEIMRKPFGTSAFRRRTVGGDPVGLPCPRRKSPFLVNALWTPGGDRDAVDRQGANSAVRPYLTTSAFSRKLNQPLDMCGTIRQQGMRSNKCFAMCSDCAGYSAIKTPLRQPRYWPITFASISWNVAVSRTGSRSGSVCKARASR